MPEGGALDTSNPSVRLAIILICIHVTRSRNQSEHIFVTFFPKVIKFEFLFNVEFK